MGVDFTGSVQDELRHLAGACGRVRRAVRIGDYFIERFELDAGEAQGGGSGVVGGA
jgi:hypothetical protein